MTTDPKNPDLCTIQRVENGWVLHTGNRHFYEGTQHVFLTCRQLATFIEDNFRLPRPTQEEGK